MPPGIERVRTRRPYPWITFVKSDRAQGLLTFRSSTDLQADLPSDLPRHVAGAVDHAVQRALGHITGIWEVSLRRAAGQGRWRLELRGPTGRHIWLFMGRVDALTAIVSDKLSVFVQVATLTYNQRHHGQSLIRRADYPAR